VSPPLLELRDVRVDRAGRTILDVPRLELRAGTTIGVLGPNGAGKSTLLRVAAALLSPTTGRVMLDGRRASRRELRAVTSAVLQRPLLRRGSVRANVETGMRFHRVAREAMHDRSRDWMRRLGIAELADRAATSLSGGEAQRVSLARALAVEPRLLLLDEPFSALDAPTRAELLADLREVLSETGTAALMVTHDRDEAAALSDFVAVLHEGGLRQHGRTVEVLDHPADRECARTLGFDTVVAAELAERWLGPGAGEIALRAVDCRVDEDVGEAGVPARLRRIVGLGPIARVVVEIDGHVVQASAPTPVPGWLAAASPGDRVRLHVRPDAARRLGAPADAPSTA
jgi:tungstate transport system ATP-binding protein